MPLATLLVPLENPWTVGVHQLGFIMFQEVIEYFLKNHLNQNYKWLGNLDALLVFLESPWWVGFNEGDLEFLRFEVQEILNFE
jgi:hypothetical protein